MPEPAKPRHAGLVHQRFTLCPYSGPVLALAFVDVVESVGRTQSQPWLPFPGTLEDSEQVRQATVGTAGVDQLERVTLDRPESVGQIGLEAIGRDPRLARQFGAHLDHVPLLSRTERQADIELGRAVGGQTLILELRRVKHVLANQPGLLAGVINLEII